MANVSDQVPNSTGDLWADLLQATAGTFAVGVRQYLATCRRHARLLYNAYHTISRSRQGSQAAITTLLKTMQNVAALLWNEIYTMEEAFEIFYPFKAINDVIHQHQNKLEEVKPDLTTLDADYRKFVEGRQGSCKRRGAQARQRGDRCCRTGCRVERRRHRRFGRRG